jgi:hypothetical protein
VTQDVMVARCQDQELTTTRSGCLNS